MTNDQRLFVTYQTIVADFVCPMAVDALAHRPVHALPRVGGVLLIAVAGLALHIRFDVAVIGEGHVGLLLEDVHAPPRRLLIARRKIPQLLYLAAVGLHSFSCHRAIGVLPQTG